MTTSPPVFVLLTDFGLGDPYVGQMKGVLVQGCPGCTILDLSHGVEPQNILQGGFFLAASWPYLPQGGVCIGVVDPGVGTDRGVLLVEKQGRTLLVPDNGLAGQVLDLKGEHTLWSLAGQGAGRQASATFHGRDLFAPLAVRLARESGPEGQWTPLGETDIQVLDAARPQQTGDRITATVLHVDRFGNCILNLAIREWEPVLCSSPQWELVEPVSSRVQLVRTYQEIDHGGVGLLKGSQTMFELAVNQASCARRLNLKIGSRCVLQPS